MMKKLTELLNSSKDKSYANLVEKAKQDNVVKVDYIFEEKKRQDRWWNEALERNKKVNNIEVGNE